MAKKQKPAWFSMLPRGLDPSKLSLDQLRSFKGAHDFLNEEIQVPEGIAYYIRSFRSLLFFAAVCIIEGKYPPLTRCWNALEKLFKNDPAFDDGVFVQSWILMDFPFGPEGQTALDYFEVFLKGSEVAQHYQGFIDEGRRSRLGLHQDVGRTKKVGKFRELFTDRVFEAFPSVMDYEKGEILLTRTMAYGGKVFFFGDAKGFPGEMKSEIERMVGGKLFYFQDKGTTLEQYEAFMKLAGPYWMSCVTKNDAVPILSPDHYRTYLGGR